MRQTMVIAMGLHRMMLEIAAAWADTVLEPTTSESSSRDSTDGSSSSGGTDPSSYSNGGDDGSWVMEMEGRCAEMQPD